MLTVNEAIAVLLEQADCLVGTETVSLHNAAGRTLSADLVAPLDVPPADNSAMDGYAFRHADWKSADDSIELNQRITAGSVPTPLQAGTAARIFTGAEVPPGADTVVMQENTEGLNEAVRILKCPDPGANIRPRGQDIHTGQVVLTSGHRLKPQDLGLVASLGLAEVEVFKPLKAAVMSTGDELREPGQKLEPGQIYNSNRYTMKALLESWGIEVVDLGVARDTPEAVREMLEKAAGMADVILTSGGVSVGEEDHVKDVVESLGSIDLWKIAIKPGKPFAFGRVGSVPFLGLPGNPVSVFVTLLLIGRPFLLRSQGIDQVIPRPLPHVCAFQKRASQREEYIRVRERDGRVINYDNQSSGVLFSTSWGDGLLRQNMGEALVEEATVDYFPWSVFN